MSAEQIPDVVLSRVESAIRTLKEPHAVWTAYQRWGGVDRAKIELWGRFDPDALVQAMVTLAQFTKASREKGVDPRPYIKDAPLYSDISEIIDVLRGPQP